MVAHSLRLYIVPVSCSRVLSPCLLQHTKDAHGLLQGWFQWANAVWQCSQVPAWNCCRQCIFFLPLCTLTRPSLKVRTLPLLCVWELLLCKLLLVDVNPKCDLYWTSGKFAWLVRSKSAVFYDGHVCTFQGVKVSECAYCGNCNVAICSHCSCSYKLNELGTVTLSLFQCFLFKV